MPVIRKYFNPIFKVLCFEWMTKQKKKIHLVVGYFC